MHVHDSGSVMAMKDAPSDSRLLLLCLLYAVWVGLIVLALAGALGREDTTRYLGLQAVAGMVGFAVYGVGRQWPPKSSVRSVSIVPLIVAGVHLVGILAVMMLAGRF